MMSIRQRKQMLLLAVALVGLGGLAVLATGLMIPVSLAAENTSDSAGAAPVPASTGADPQALLAQLKSIAALDLRRPLGADGSAIPAEGASLAVKLVGTISEGDHSMALLQKSDGSVKVCPAGQSIDDAGGRVTVLRIERNTVTVQFNAQSFELAMPPPPPGRLQP
jgi:hypothetical protein